MEISYETDLESNVKVILLKLGNKVYNEQATMTSFSMIRRSVEFDSKWRKLDKKLGDYNRYILFE